VEFDLTSSRADDGADVHITGPGLLQLLQERRVRLDVDARPTLLAKPLRDGVQCRMVRADVDPESARDVGQGAPQRHILVVLRVADHGRQELLRKYPRHSAECSCRAKREKRP
jgi:hypothetical protein